MSLTENPSSFAIINVMNTFVNSFPILRYIRTHNMKKEIRIRCRIDIDGEKFFGPGPAELLQLVEETGSIANAAKSMGMSYKKAWGIIMNMNSRSPKPLVISHKGGKNRGGAEVTAAGKKVMAAYEKLSKQLDAVIKKNSAILNLI